MWVLQNGNLEIEQQTFVWTKSETSAWRLLHFWFVSGLFTLWFKYIYKNQSSLLEYILDHPIFYFFFLCSFLFSVLILYLIWLIHHFYDIFIKCTYFIHHVLIELLNLYALSVLFCLKGLNFHIVLKKKFFS